MDVDSKAPGRRRQGAGSVRLVLIGVAAGSLAACGSDPNDQPQDLARANYASKEACEQDWGSADQCEPRLVSDNAASYSSEQFNPEGWQGQAASGTGSHGVSSGGSPYRSTRLNWWGPYFSRSGQVYHYDGRVTTMASQPTRASAVLYERASLNEVYGLRGGRYATTPTHPNAASVKTSAPAAMARGGFGSTGRAGSGGG